MKTIRGWLGASHPFPLAMVLLLTALIGLASAGGTPDAGRFVLVLLAMLSSQLSIGWSNDYLDRHVDAVHQPSKPVPSGLVNPGLMPPAIGVALAVSGAAGVALGGVPLLLLAAGTLCGLGYNLGLKQTSFGAGAFIVAFAVLPLFVWTSLDVYSADLLALYPIGLTLPVAVHIANVLPDRDTDRAQGRMTVAVRLGRARAVALLWACHLVPLLLVVLSLLWLQYQEAVLAATVAAYVALSATGMALYTRRRRSADVWAFRCLVTASVLFAAGWLAAR